MNSTKLGFWILVIFSILFKISDVRAEIKAAEPPPTQIETKAEPETVLFLLLPAAAFQNPAFSAPRPTAVYNAIC